MFQKMFQKKAKLVEYVVLLIALVALGFSIASILKPCKKSDFADTCIDAPGGEGCPFAGWKCGVGDPGRVNCGDMRNCYCKSDPSPTSCKGEVGALCNFTEQGMQCCASDSEGKHLICKDSGQFGEYKCQHAVQPTPTPRPDPSQDYLCDRQQNASDCNSQTSCNWNYGFNMCEKR